jgi:hypothetical protein
VSCSAQAEAASKCTDDDTRVLPWQQRLAEQNTQRKRAQVQVQQQQQQVSSRPEQLLELEQRTAWPMAKTRNCGSAGAN